MDFKTNKELFDYVFKKGGGVYSPFLSLKFFNSTVSKKNKFFFVISSKISKKATVRNLFKRRGRNIIAKNIKGGVSGIFFAKKGISELTFSQLETEMISLLKRAKVLG